MSNGLETMDCGLNSPEQIAVCIHTVQRWFSVIVDFAGLGSFALIAILVWITQKLRLDLSIWEEKSKQALEEKRLAEEAKKQAEHRAILAERQADRASQDLEIFKINVTETEDTIQTQLVKIQSQLNISNRRIEDAIKITSKGAESFWSRPIGLRFPEYERRISNSKPIFMFANQKGGVGKTTLVTNLAACFASRGETVLTVDLDYQGSHSSLMQRESNHNQEEPESLIDFLFENELGENWNRIVLKKINDNLYYIPAFYNFELVERRVEYEWTLGTCKDDVRYRLARALLSPEIQSKFDRILIDAPPRFTLGFVNGFCCATNLYVPTIVDRVSAPAVGTFARQFSELKAVVNPGIRWSGIIGTNTFTNTNSPLELPQAASDAANAAEREARIYVPEAHFIRNPVIRRDAGIASASEFGIPYMRESKVRPMFDKLADVIIKNRP